MMWHNEHILEFIEQYRNEPCIWDARHPHHRNRAVLSNAWERIQHALSFECTISELKKKKESLMASYRLLRRKMKDEPDGFPVTWFAFPLMNSFLDEIYGNSEVNQNTEFQLLNSSSNEHQYTIVSDKKVPIKRPKLQSKPTTSSPNPYFDKKSTSFIATDEPQEMDECELYTKLLAKKLRRLDEHQRDLAMHEIDNIVFKAKMSSKVHRKQEKSLLRKVNSPEFLATVENQQYEEEEETVYQEDPIQDS